MSDTEKVVVEQLLHTKGDEPLQTKEGKLYVRAVDLEELFKNGVLNAAIQGKKIEPISMETTATAAGVNVPVNGMVDVIINDGANDMTFSLDGGQTLHTLRADESWSPSMPIYVENVRCRASIDTPFRLWGWR